MEQNKTDGLSIAALITSIVSLLTCGSIWIVSLALSIGGLSRTKKTGGSGKAMSIAGIVISAVSGLVSICVVIIYLFVWIIYLFLIFVMIVSGAGTKGSYSEAHYDANYPSRHKYVEEYSIDDVEEYFDDYIYNVEGCEDCIKIYDD